MTPLSHPGLSVSWDGTLCVSISRDQTVKVRAEYGQNQAITRERHFVITLMHVLNKRETVGQSVCCSCFCFSQHCKVFRGITSRDQFPTLLSKLAHVDQACSDTQKHALTYPTKFKYNLMDTAVCMLMYVIHCALVSVAGRR